MGVVGVGPVDWKLSKSSDRHERYFAEDIKIAHSEIEEVSNVPSELEASDG